MPQWRGRCCRRHEQQTCGSLPAMREGSPTALAEQQEEDLQLANLALEKLAAEQAILDAQKAFAEKRRKRALAKGQ